MKHLLLAFVIHYLIAVNPKTIKVLNPQKITVQGL